MFVAAVSQSRVCLSKNKFGLRPDEFFRESLHRLNVGSGPARVDPDVAALRPPELLEFLPERRDDRPCFRGVLGKVAPMRRTRWSCCARAASGHVAAAPPRSAMNSRRLK